MWIVRIGSASAEDIEVAELLFAAIGGDRHRLAVAAQRYRDSKAANLIAATIDDELVGVAGYEVHRNHIVLLHIAAAVSRRRCGIGRQLLSEIRSRHRDLAIIAETDTAAVGFYLATGFTVSSLGEKYSGVERFQVLLNPATARDPAPATHDAL
ncbi:GNAT family N-acetyltransferase [Nocardia sp. NPDC050710]|uniref:GNAT family N-acetyltransferase n=1 Tax=Nocardia sp. NPDC050710 TaxID=3157220 RepID=UPI0033D22F71